MLSVTGDPHKFDNGNERMTSKPANDTDRNQGGNNMQINKLPVEVLARIFVLGEGMLRGHRASRLPYVSFQDLCIQVCRRWRDIAISTPTLWTYIFISQPPPYLRAQSYINRSGSRPLIIDIDMRKKDIEPSIRLDPQLQTRQILDIFEFIVGCGGTFDRWRSLIISSRLAPVIFDIISFIGSTPTPNLQFLSLTWRGCFSERWVLIREQEAMAHTQGHTGDSDPYSLVHGPLRPQLRHVELGEFPSAFTFNLSAPRFSNLTSLRFSNLTGGACPTIQGFSTLLSANSRLESLRLDICGESPDYPAPTSLPSLQVHLPSLHSLSLGCLADSEWALQILQITDAPALEYFKLYMTSPYLATGRSPSNFFRYLGKGRLNGDLQCTVPPERPTSTYSSIFPSLRHLDVAHMTGHFASMLPLLEAFPSATHVSLDYLGLDALNIRPELIPNASHFTYNAHYTGSTTDALRQVALRRVDAELRIPFLEIITKEQEGLLAQIGSEVGGTDGDHVPPLRQLVDKIEVREQELMRVPTPDSDDDQLSFSGDDSEFSHEYPEETYDEETDDEEIDDEEIDDEE